MGKYEEIIFIINENYYSKQNLDDIVTKITAIITKFNICDLKKRAD